MPARILLQMRPGSAVGDAGFGDLTPGMQAALLRLEGAGIAEEDLETLVAETDGALGLAVLQLALGSLARRGLLSYAAQGDAGLLAAALSTTTFELQRREVRAEARYVFSRFALIRRVGERAVIESPRSSAQIAIHDARVMALIGRLVAPCRLDTACCELSAGEVAVLASLLLGCDVLEEAHDDEGASAYWSFHDLLFHSRTRMGRHQGGYGATYPFRGRVKPPPAIKPSMSEEAVELDTADLGRLRREDVPFTAVLEDRHTTRRFGDPPLHRRQLGEFLYRVARQRSTYEGEAGMQRGSRPYPGGGAVYELEIYLSVGACVELPAGLYHYRPGEHQLSRLPARPELVTALLRKAVQVPEMVPQVLLTIAARFPRIFWKYESMGYALVLKDVGVLYQTMYLVAEAMGLGACALGGGDSDLFAAAAGVDSYAEASVGEFVIGSRAEGNP